MYSLASIHSFETAFPPGRVADPFSHAGPFTPGNCHQDSPRSSLQHFADLPVLGLYFVHDVLPTLSCGIFDHCGWELSRLSMPRMQRTFGFVLTPFLVGFFLCSKSIFHRLAPPRGHFLPLFTTTIRFRLRIRVGTRLFGLVDPVWVVLVSRRCGQNMKSYRNLTCSLFLCKCT